MIAAILAAGASKRFGRCKLVEAINGKPMIQHVVENLPSDLPVYIVTGHYEKEVRASTRHLNVEYIHNPFYENGIGTSLKTAAKVALKLNQPLLVTLGDLPFVSTDNYKKLMQSASGQPVFSGFAGEFGPPAVFPIQHLPILLNVAPSKGARSVFESFGTVEIPSAAKDIDRPEDLNLQRQLP